ncbi:hypothetical protein [Variovorax paradoxus]
MKAILQAQLMEIQRQIAAMRRHYAEVRRKRAVAPLTWCAA